MIRTQPTPTRPNRCAQLSRTNDGEHLLLRRIVERRGRLAPRLLHQLVVADEVADAQRRQARLARAEEVAGAAQLEVASRR